MRTRPRPGDWCHHEPLVVPFRFLGPTPRSSTRLTTKPITLYVPNRFFASDRRVDAIECLECYQKGPNAEETCSDVQYERECAPGSVCFSQRTKEYGKTTAFERSCAPEIECSTACLTNGACTYCCHSDLCNRPQNDRLIPGKTLDGWGGRGRELRNCFFFREFRF